METKAVYRRLEVSMDGDIGRSRSRQSRVKTTTRNTLEVPGASRGGFVGGGGDGNGGGDDIDVGVQSGSVSNASSPKRASGKVVPQSVERPESRGPSARRASLEKSLYPEPLDPSRDGSPSRLRDKLGGWLTDIGTTLKSSPIKKIGRIRPASSLESNSAPLEGDRERSDQPSSPGPVDDTQKTRSPFFKGRGKYKESLFPKGNPASSPSATPRATKAISRSRSSSPATDAKKGADGVDRRDRVKDITLAPRDGGSRNSSPDKIRGIGKISPTVSGSPSPTKEGHLHMRKNSLKKVGEYFNSRTPPRRTSPTKGSSPPKVRDIGSERDSPVKSGERVSRKSSPDKDGEPLNVKSTSEYDRYKYRKISWGYPHNTDVDSGKELEERAREKASKVPPKPNRGTKVGSKKLENEGGTPVNTPDKSSRPPPSPSRRVAQSPVRPVQAESPEFQNSPSREPRTSPDRRSTSVSGRAKVINVEEKDSLEVPDQQVLGVSDRARANEADSSPRHSSKSVEKVERTAFGKVKSRKRSPSPKFSSPLQNPEEEVPPHSRIRKGGDEEQSPLGVAADQTRDKQGSGLLERFRVKSRDSSPSHKQSSPTQSPKKGGQSLLGKIKPSSRESSPAPKEASSVSVSVKLERAIFGKGKAKNVNSSPSTKDSKSEKISRVLFGKERVRSEEGVQSVETGFSENPEKLKAELLGRRKARSRDNSPSNLPPLVKPPEDSGSRSREGKGNKESSPSRKTFPQTDTPEKQGTHSLFGIETGRESSPPVGPTPSEEPERVSPRASGKKRSKNKESTPRRSSKKPSPEEQQQPGRQKTKGVSPPTNESALQTSEKQGWSIFSINKSKSGDDSPKESKPPLEPERLSPEYSRRVEVRSRGNSPTEKTRTPLLAAEKLISENLLKGKQKNKENSPPTDFPSLGSFFGLGITKSREPSPSRDGTPVKTPEKIDTNFLANLKFSSAPPVESPSSKNPEKFNITEAPEKARRGVQSKGKRAKAQEDSSRKESLPSQNPEISRENDSPPEPLTPLKGQEDLDTQVLAKLELDPTEGSGTNQNPEKSSLQTPEKSNRGIFGKGKKLKSRENSPRREPSPTQNAESKSKESVPKHSTQSQGGSNTESPDEQKTNLAPEGSVPTPSPEKATTDQTPERSLRRIIGKEKKAKIRESSPRGEPENKSPVRSQNREGTSQNPDLLRTQEKQSPKVLGQGDKEKGSPKFVSPLQPTEKQRGESLIEKSKASFTSVKHSEERKQPSSEEKGRSRESSPKEPKPLQTVENPSPSLAKKEKVRSRDSSPITAANIQTPEKRSRSLFSKKKRGKEKRAAKDSSKLRSRSPSCESVPSIGQSSEPIPATERRNSRSRLRDFVGLEGGKSLLDVQIRSRSLSPAVAEKSDGVKAKRSRNPTLMMERIYDLGRGKGFGKANAADKVQNDEVPDVAKTSPPPMSSALKSSRVPLSPKKIYPESSTVQVAPFLVENKKQSSTKSKPTPGSKNPLVSMERLYDRSIGRNRSKSDSSSKSKAEKVPYEQNSSSFPTSEDRPIDMPEPNGPEMSEDLTKPPLSKERFYDFKLGKSRRSGASRSGSREPSPKHSPEHYNHNSQSLPWELPIDPSRGPLKSSKERFYERLGKSPVPFSGSPKTEEVSDSTKAFSRTSPPHAELMMEPVFDFQKPSDYSSLGENRWRLRRSDRSLDELSYGSMSIGSAASAGGVLLPFQMPPVDSNIAEDSQSVPNTPSHVKEKPKGIMSGLSAKIVLSPRKKKQKDKAEAKGILDDFSSKTGVLVSSPKENQYPLSLGSRPSPLSPVHTQIGPSPFKGKPEDHVPQLSSLPKHAANDSEVKNSPSKPPSPKRNPLHSSSRESSFSDDFLSSLSPAKSDTDRKFLVSGDHSSKSQAKKKKKIRVKLPEKSLSLDAVPDIPTTPRRIPRRDKLRFSDVFGKSFKKRKFVGSGDKDFDDSRANSFFKVTEDDSIDQPMDGFQGSESGFASFDDLVPHDDRIIAAVKSYLRSYDVVPNSDDDIELNPEELDIIRDLECNLTIFDLERDSAAESGSMTGYSHNSIDSGLKSGDKSIDSETNVNLKSGLRSILKPNGSSPERGTPVDGREITRVINCSETMEAYLRRDEQRKLSPCPSPNMETQNGVIKPRESSRVRFNADVTSPKKKRKVKKKRRSLKLPKDFDVDHESGGSSRLRDTRASERHHVYTSDDELVSKSGLGGLVHSLFGYMFCSEPVTVEGIVNNESSQDDDTGDDPDPLPPPIPSHKVDPATLHPSGASSSSPSAPSAPSATNNRSGTYSHSGSTGRSGSTSSPNQNRSTSTYGSSRSGSREPPPSDPEFMTADEAKKLLSSNIIRGKRRENSSVLSDEEAHEVALLLSPPRDQDFAPPVPPHYVPLEDEYDTRVASHFDPTLASPLSPEEEPSEADSSESSGDIAHVARVKEVLVEDGVHYLEDGHFWVEVPGLPDEDEADEEEHNIPFHQHTKLRFSIQPMQVFSTYSITEYDRKNEDVDPVAASAEYELEKRVEKMDVFPVEIEKGEGGLGLSIIGMGVGADAGVEKLGIFVKTITPLGATEKDGRIQVNDQIIEVDGKSLVGVTQVFAASVLKNTSGRVYFLIGREKDPENSEVAQLIRQSLQADREREERRRALGGPEYDHRSSHGLFDPPSSPSDDNSRSEDHIHGNLASYVDGGSSPASPDTTSPTPEVFDLEGDTSDTSPENDANALRLKLKEVQYRNAVAEAEITKLKSRVLELEFALAEHEKVKDDLFEANENMKDLEGKLRSTCTEAETYQDMLKQSQGQYIILEKKYYKAKKIIKEYQTRESDFLHREEYHITQQEEKDTHYNAIMKALKDRVIQLESELALTQKKAGLPVQVPSDGINALAHATSPQASVKKEPPPSKPSLSLPLDSELSDTEGSDGSHEEDKANTVERKLPVKEELDRAVPPHELLDVSASRAKGELATRGGLANRQLPSLKKTSSMNSAGSVDRSLDETGEDETVEPQVNASQEIRPQESLPDSQNTEGHNVMLVQTTGMPLKQQAPFMPVGPGVNSQQQPQQQLQQQKLQQQHQLQQHQLQQQQQQSVILNSTQYQAPTTCTPDTLQSKPNQLTFTPPHMHYDQTSPTRLTDSRPEIPYRHPPPVARVQPVNRAEITESTSLASHLAQRTPQQQSIAEQLKALLAESFAHEDGLGLSRDEKTEESRHERDASPNKRSPTSLMEDVRQAVMQADASLGKKPIISGPVNVASTAQLVSTGQMVQQMQSSPHHPPHSQPAFFPPARDGSKESLVGSRSPALMHGHLIGQHGNTPSGVILLSQKSLEASIPSHKTGFDNAPAEDLRLNSGPASLGSLDDGSGASLGSQSSLTHTPQPPLEKKQSHLWQSGPVYDWSKEQVSQWLLVHGLESHIPKFLEAGITGTRLINLDTRDLKNLGLQGEDKNKLKRKVKDLRITVEKERKQAEKEKKEKEKLQKKAEKLAEKAEKRKK